VTKKKISAPRKEVPKQEREGKKGNPSCGKNLPAEKRRKRKSSKKATEGDSLSSADTERQTPLSRSKQWEKKGVLLSGEKEGSPDRTGKKKRESIPSAR